ncbi:hypothetical protein RclHR1_00130005 [Rhizophagus clarus]|uniref:Uncharacterized protein n=1 Tax=Rhizophagus clarus TaxID=94130 RepID=A0A2Z6QNP0_9GLOM|nr:hypothetical protein RclHR1_00130005 [Rhizophagus clarus]
MAIDAIEQGKQLVKTFDPKADPVKYKPLSQKTQILNILIVHIGLRAFMSSLNYSCELMVISGDTHHHIPQSSPDLAIDQLILNQSATVSEPVISLAQDVLTQQVEDMQIEDQQHLFSSGPIPSGSTTTSKPKKNKVLAKAVKKYIWIFIFLKTKETI